VAKHYEGLLSGFIFDQVDKELKFEIENLGMQTMMTDSLMKNLEGKIRVAKDVLKFIDTLL
jgi:hypothetical protein